MDKYIRVIVHMFPCTAYKYIASAKEPNVPIDQKDGHRALVIVLEMGDDENALKEMDIPIDATIKWAKPTCACWYRSLGDCLIVVVIGLGVGGHNWSMVFDSLSTHAYRFLHTAPIVIIKVAIFVTFQVSLMYFSGETDGGRRAHLLH